MDELLALRDMESDEKELVPEILPVDARLSISGSASALASLFASANAVTPLKEVIPNTSYVLLEAFDQTAKAVSYVQVSATDGERAIAVLDEGFSVRMSGAVLVPGKKISDILKLALADEVRLDVVGTSATIRSGRAIWTVSTPPAELSLPSFASTENIALHTVSTSSLTRALELVYPAVSKTTARQSLMQVEVAKGFVTACDGVRAHRVRVEEFPKSLSTAIPLRFLETALKELKGHSEEYVQFGSDHSTVVFHFGKNILMGQRLNFDYPAVEHLVLGPALSNEESLHVNVEELTGAVRRVRVNADPDFSALFLSLRTTKGVWSLTVRARDTHGNSSQETISAAYEGSATAKDIVVNHKYFLEFLACLHGDVTLKLGESTKTKQSPIYVEEDTFVGSLMVMAPNFVR
jgi:DNA polymerase III sliding clamp (beta) subunit (PCNA family)